MTCKHEHIQTWRFEDGQPAMWSCVDCAAKFEPIKGWMAQVERKDALLKQALDALAADSIPLSKLSDVIDDITKEVQ